MDASAGACLDLHYLNGPRPHLSTYLLSGDETRIGRLEEGEPGVQLEGYSISRKHACVRRQVSGGAVAYVLTNLRGRSGVRLYEHLLLPGDQHILHHGYTFQIPGVLATQDEPHYLIQFRVDDQQTSLLGFELCEPPNLRIFGQIIRFTPQEYALLAFLYRNKGQLCPYAEVIAAIWAPRPHPAEQAQAYLAQLYAHPDLLSVKREALDILLAKVRGKIKAASAGVALIETVRGVGLCLRIASFSGCGRDS